MEKKEFKRYIVIAVLAVAVCFIVQNFAVFTKVISAALGALYPLALGAVMAYIINIIMKWYEEHYFPKKDTKFITASRRPVALVLSLLSVAAICALVLNIIDNQRRKAHKSEAPAALQRREGVHSQKARRVPRIAATGKRSPQRVRLQGARLGFPHRKAFRLPQKRRIQLHQLSSRLPRSYRQYDHKLRSRVYFRYISSPAQA